jgi:Fur family peroxide stress response transcriptional regulator
MREKLNANAQAVLDCVQKENRARVHPTALEVYEAVKKVRPHIGLASVYRILHQLVESAYLKEVRDGDESCRYDSRTGRHDHAVCTRCGVLIDLPTDVLVSEQILSDAARAAGIELNSHEVRLYGLCSSCKAQNTMNITISPSRSL